MTKAKIKKWFSDKKNKRIVIIAICIIVLLLWLNLKNTTTTTTTTTNPDNRVQPNKPPVTNPPILIDDSIHPALFGTYEKVVGNYRYTYNRSAGMSLTINDDKTITINGVDFSQVPNKQDGKNVFYATGYKIFCDNEFTDPQYRSFQNIYLPGSKGGTIHSIRMFVLDPAKVPNLATFMSTFGGWPLTGGVNKFAGNVSEVTLTITEI